jgi:hypothetical protein
MTLSIRQLHSQQHWSAANIWHLLSILEFEKAKILRDDLAYSKQRWTAAIILFFVVKDWANFIKHFKIVPGSLRLSFLFLWGLVLVFWLAEIKH